LAHHWAQCDRKYAWPKQRKKWQQSRNCLFRISQVFGIDVWHLEVLSVPYFRVVAFVWLQFANIGIVAGLGTSLFPQLWFSSSSAREWYFFNFIPDLAASRSRCQHATASETATVSTPFYV